MMGGSKCSIKGLSESPTQRAVALVAAERRGGYWKDSILIDFCSIIFIVFLHQHERFLHTNRCSCRLFWA